MLLLIAACTKSPAEAAYTKQDTKIESFITAQLKAGTCDTVIYNQGVARLVIKKGSGAELGNRGLAKIN